MKKLGLIGGTGPESTILYYRQLAYGVKSRLNADIFPNLSIESLSVFEVLKFCEREDFAGLARYLLQGIENLKNCGCECATFTGIMPHIVFDEVSARSPLPLVSIIEAASAFAKVQNLQKVALIATKPTMSGAFFQKPFAREGIEVVLPLKNEMEFIGEKIKSEIEHGRIIEATKARFISIAKRLLNDGA